MSQRARLTAGLAGILGIALTGCGAPPSAPAASAAATNVDVTSLAVDCVRTQGVDGVRRIAVQDQLREGDEARRRRMLDRGSQPHSTDGVTGRLQDIRFWWVDQRSSSVLVGWSVQQSRPEGTVSIDAVSEGCRLQGYSPDAAVLTEALFSAAGHPDRVEVSPDSHTVTMGFGAHQPNQVTYTLTFREPVALVQSPANTEELLQSLHNATARPALFLLQHNLTTVTGSRPSVRL